MSIELVAGALVVRSWRDSDAEALHDAIVANVDHLRPFMPWAVDELKPLADRRKLIAGWNEEADAGGDEQVGLFLDQQVVGAAGLHHRIGPGGLEVGYWVHRAYTRRGFATSVSRALTDHAFTMPDIDRVEIHHDVANVASAGVLRRLGFTLVAEVAREVVASEETGVGWIWRVNREEWAAAKPT